MFKVIFYKLFYFDLLFIEVVILKDIYHPH